MVISLEEIKQRKLIEHITKELEELKYLSEEELDELYKEYYKNY